MENTNLKAKPFYLSDKELAWVEEKKSRLSIAQKAGQLFCVMGGDFPLDTLLEMVEKKGVGAVLYRPAPTAEIRKNYEALDRFAPVPLLKAANLEEGGSGGTSEGTLFGWQMEIGATNDMEMARKLGIVCASEGRRVGINISFSPVADRSVNPLNPITNVRAYGSDTELVKNFSGAYASALQSCGVAACAKHFPGDGIDFRDQHLHPTYNSLSASEWYESYGAIYRHLIDGGILGVMCGHILCPAVSMQKNPRLSFADCLPASLSKELLTGVLREEFGFNGVITTDATISKERLNAAVTRILALKAVLCLRDYETPEISEADALRWQEKCADKAVTTYNSNEDDLHGTTQIEKDTMTIYLANEQTASNRTTVRLSWCKKTRTGHSAFRGGRTRRFYLAFEPVSPDGYSPRAGLHQHLFGDAGDLTCGT